MGENGRFDGEIELPGGSFSRLLLSVEDFDHNSTLSPPLFSNNTPKMLCFGDSSSDITQQPPILTPCSNQKRRNGSGQEPEKEPVRRDVGTLMAEQSSHKNVKKNKPKVGPTNSCTVSSGHAKGRREKLGERITVLQQLVCPYGKTDTASVLHEAMGYIRFLHDQVKVLCSPYLQRLPSSSPPHHLSEKGSTKGRGPEEGLRSRGLCVVPVQCVVDIANIVDVTNGNGADFWSSATNSPSKP